MINDGGFSSLDNLEGSVLKLGPRVRGEDPSKKREYRKLGEALFEAVRDCDVDQIRQLCTIGINGVTSDPDYSDEFGFGCLHLAAKRGMLQIVEELASLGSDINASGEGGATALHMAAQYGHLKVVQKLVELGADVDLKDASGSTPLRVAEAFDRKAVSEFLRPLRDTGSGQWRLFDAAREEEERMEAAAAAAGIGPDGGYGPGSDGDGDGFDMFEEDPQAAGRPVLWADEGGLFGGAGLADGFLDAIDLDADEEPARPGPEPHPADAPRASAGAADPALAAELDDLFRGA